MTTHQAEIAKSVISSLDNLHNINISHPSFSKRKYQLQVQKIRNKFDYLTDIFTQRENDYLRQLINIRRENVEKDRSNEFHFSRVMKRLDGAKVMINDLVEENLMLATQLREFVPKEIRIEERGVKLIRVEQGVVKLRKEGMIRKRVVMSKRKSFQKKIAHAILQNLVFAVYEYFQVSEAKIWIFNSFEDHLKLMVHIKSGTLLDFDHDNYIEGDELTREVHVNEHSLIPKVFNSFKGVNIIRYSESEVKKVANLKFEVELKTEYVLALPIVSIFDNCSVGVCELRNKRNQQCFTFEDEVKLKHYLEMMANVITHDYFKEFFHFQSGGTITKVRFLPQKASNDAFLKNMIRIGNIDGSGPGMDVDIESSLEILPDNLRMYVLHLMTINTQNLHEISKNMNKIEIMNQKMTCKEVLVSGHERNITELRKKIRALKKEKKQGKTKRRKKLLRRNSVFPPIEKGGKKEKNRATVERILVRKVGSTVPVPFVIIDGERKILHANYMMRNLFSVTERVKLIPSGSSVTDFLENVNENMLERVIKQGVKYIKNVHLKVESGNIKKFTVAMKPITYAKEKFNLLLFL